VCVGWWDQGRPESLDGGGSGNTVTHCSSTYMPLYGKIIVKSLLSDPSL